MSTEVTQWLNKEDFYYYVKKFGIIDSQVSKEKAPDAHAYHIESFYVLIGSLRLVLKARIPS